MTAGEDLKTSKFKDAVLVGKEDALLRAFTRDFRVYDMR